jgi:mono/diheme cytochrome c family protein
VEEILAELLSADRGREIAVSRRDHAEIQLELAVSADGNDRSRLQELEQARLQPRAQLADLVEKDRAAVGDLEPAHAPLVRAGERATLVAEELGLEGAFVERGQNCYQIYCAPCHGGLGDGNGITKSYGMVATPTYHDDRLRGMSEGEIFNTITNGKNTMFPYADKLSAEDRWAVIAYAHTLSGHRGPHVASEHPELKPKPKFVNGEGTVIALRPEKQQIVLEHSGIKGFMEAMTMGFPVPEASEWAKLKPGMKIRGTVVEKKDDFYLTAIQEEQ